MYFFGIKLFFCIKVDFPIKKKEKIEQYIYF